MYKRYLAFLFALLYFSFSLSPTMLIPSQREMVFLQSKSFFLCIDPLVQLELPEEQHKLKKIKEEKEGEENDGTLECS